jgi:outer membrane protein insertion porin family
MCKSRPVGSWSRVHASSGGSRTSDAGAVDKTVEDLALALAKGGSPFAAALPRSERVPDQHLINLVYTIVDDKRVYVERIDIHGNIKTRDDVIRREFDFVEGDAYNRALIERGERRLKQLGYFKTVRISDKPGSAPDRVVIPAPTACRPRSRSAMRISSAPAMSPRPPPPSGNTPEASTFR